MVAGKTPVRLQPLEANKAKEHRLEAGGLGTLEVDAVKTAARFETPVPSDVVVAGHVPSVAGFLALSARLPDVFEAVWKAAQVVELEGNSCVTRSLFQVLFPAQ